MEKKFKDLVASILIAVFVSFLIYLFTSVETKFDEFLLYLLFLTPYGLPVLVVLKSLKEREKYEKN